MISAPEYTTHINTKLQEDPQAYLSSSLTSINVVFIPKYVLQKALLRVSFEQVCSIEPERVNLNTSR